MGSYEKIPQCMMDAINIPKEPPEIKILVGLPRSGKTTYTEQQGWRFTTVSADALRYLVYGQRFWGPGEDLMWSIRKIVLKMLMEQGKNIIIDETNTTVTRRKPIIELAKKYGYRITAVVFLTKKEECIARTIEGEERDLLTPVINRMSEQFEVVDKRLEGIDYIEFKN